MILLEKPPKLESKISARRFPLASNERDKEALGNMALGTTANCL